MFQTFRLLCLTIFTLNTIFCEDTYVIYTTEEFKQSAELISTLHNEIIPLELGLTALNTQIKYKEDLNQQEFTTYLDDNFDNFNKKYLLIIGDESIISPIVPSCSDTYTLVDYTDDVFSNEFTVGRLLVKNNQEALDQIYKIDNGNIAIDFEIFKGMGGLDESNRLDVPLLAKIPIDSDLATCTDNGTPYVYEHKTDISDYYEQIANKVKSIIFKEYDK